VGIPRDNSTSAVYYNKDLFAATGLKEPATNWTWDDYRTAAQKLTAPDKQRFGSTFPAVDTTAPALQLSVLRCFGGDWFDSALKQVLVDSPKSRDALTFMADLRLRDHVVGRAEELAPGDQMLTQHADLSLQQQGYVQNLKRGNPSFNW